MINSLAVVYNNPYFYLPKRKTRYLNFSLHTCLRLLFPPATLLILNSKIMQQDDLALLIAELAASLNQPATAQSDTILQQKIAPLLTADLQEAIVNPVTINPPVVSPVENGGNKITITSAFPFANPLLEQSPTVFSSIRNYAANLAKEKIADVVKENVNLVNKNIGTGISNIIHPGGVIPIHPFPVFIQETISVFLDTNTTYPAIIVPVNVRVFGLVLPGTVTSYTIEAGSIFILSQLLCSTAPAGMYTGLTISGGTITFSQQMSLVNKVITMPAGSICSVSLNLQQPVDATVPPGNFGIDAVNAQVQLPTQFSFTLTDSIISIVSITQASWNLYGCACTFQFTPAQSPIYNHVQNGIYIGGTVSATTFIVSQCDSPFFTLQGSAPIIDGYWDLPVASIDITQANTASGIGSLAVLCSPGLQASWTGLKGGPVNLTFPLLSATIGGIGVTDSFAGNRYASQHYNLWSNEITSLLSTLDLTYTDNFSLVYVSLQEGGELLNTSTQFSANIDRPVRVDASPVSVKGRNGLLSQFYNATGNKFFFYDNTLIAENYPAPPGAVANVPQEAIALTNALMTVTPVSGIVIYGQLATQTTFIQAKLFLSFGLFYLIPALPDPYVSSRLTILGGLRGNNANIDIGQEQKTLPLNEVVSLLSSVVSWPQAGATDPTAPQFADVSFGIFPLPDNSIFQSAQTKEAVSIKPADTADPDPQQTWDQSTSQFASPGFAMLDVSTNADLMGVSFSTTNIQVQNAVGAVGYVIQPVDNSSDTDILQILGLDLATPGKFVRAFTVPEVSWEPVVNLAKDAPSKSGAPNPPAGQFLLFGDDGGPTQFFNNSSAVVPIAPIKVSNFIVDSYTNKDPANPVITASLFTLPFGMKSFALLPAQADPGYQPATLSIDPQVFDITAPGIPNAPKKTVSGGLQIIAKGQQDTMQPNLSPSFMGFSIQLRNVLDDNGNVTNTSILGPDVDTIFNDEFQPPFVRDKGVPVERIDFSGYGASLFSNWQDPNASIAATSQAKFDVIVGRTSLEIVQVRSLVYPWGIRVVRTVTMYRSGSALVFRVDSGWRADTDGVYDFSYKDENGNSFPNPYVFHPGVVKGVFNVKNIIENDLPQFPIQISGGGPPVTLLQPVYFDADVQIDNVIQGASSGKVPSKQMLGYVQIAPEGVPISPALFSNLLASQAGSLGGPVDCIVNIGGIVNTVNNSSTGQKMRVNSVDVSNSVDQGGAPVFAGTARGTVILPKDGSWSVVQHSQLTDAVSAINNNAAVPLIRIGQLLVDGTSDYPANQLRLANPIDLLKDPDATTINYGLLQNTSTQKVLYQLPAYVSGVTQLLSKGNNFPLGKFADAFHLLNSTGIFPNPGDMPAIDFSNYSINLIDEGYQLLNKLNPGQLLQQVLPSPFYFVNTKDIQIYVNYNAGNGQNLNYNIDSAASNWESSAKNITLNIALGGLPSPFNPLMYIDGDFSSDSGTDSAFTTPDLKFSSALQPVIDILQILEQLSTSDPHYGDIAKQVLQVAMSNSGDNFEYKFHADKEIATLQFPPAELDGPTTPLRLTAGLKVGAYFNEAISITSDPSSLIPSAGAYFEFDGGIQVMCVSLAAATVYAVGQVVVKISADLKTGPSLDMKFGFGVELMVGLPVVGNVSVTYMVGIEMALTSTNIKVTAFLLFKGEAQLIGGMVDITITIEASGSIDRGLAAGPTTITAQVTFAIDISIFLVIDINFSKSWSESRQIA
jgi:hypothetical protein